MQTQSIQQVIHPRAWQLERVLLFIPLNMALHIAGKVSLHKDQYSANSPSAF